MVSTIPACLDALVALAGTALPDVLVVDGQPFDLKPELVCIGFTGVPGEPAVISTRSREQMAAEPDLESYDVINVASALHGKTDTKPVRDRAHAFVDAIAAALAADPTLDDAVARTRISVAEYTPMQTTDGAAATIQFTIHVDAWTR